MATIIQAPLSTRIIYSIMTLNAFISNITQVEREIVNPRWDKDLQLLLSSPRQMHFFARMQFGPIHHESSNEV